MAQTGCGRKWVIARLKWPTYHFKSLGIIQNHHAFEIFWVISACHPVALTTSFTRIVRATTTITTRQPPCLTQGNCLLRGCLQAFFDPKQELSYEMICWNICTDLDEFEAKWMGDYCHGAESGKLRNTKCNWAELSLRFWIVQNPKVTHHHQHHQHHHHHHHQQYLSGCDNTHREKKSMKIVID